MILNREWIEQLVFGDDQSRRYLQDSPVLPDVWISYGAKPGELLDLLVTPYGDTRPGGLATLIRKQLGDTAPMAEVAYNQAVVVLRLTFHQVIDELLPLSGWWIANICNIASTAGGKQRLLDQFRELVDREDLAHVFRQPSRLGPETVISSDLLWMVRVLGSLQLGIRASGKTEAQRKRAWDKIVSDPKSAVESFNKWIHDRLPGPVAAPLVYSVNINRKASVSLSRSVPAIKADAAHRLFRTSTSDLTWAIMDSGIDATHPAFRKKHKPGKASSGLAPDENGLITYNQPFESSGATDWHNRTRIKATYDFTRIRKLLLVDADQLLDPNSPVGNYAIANPEALPKMREDLQNGIEIDWNTVAPMLRVPHQGVPAANGKFSVGDYQPPENDHGTHVAGILAADWSGHIPDSENPLPGREDGPELEASAPAQPIRGVCPDIKLYDIRVLDASGTGDEFSVIAALQFIRYQNAHKDFIDVHGVNLSLSIPHDVANYACGGTPICQECDRLVNAGIVVVAAAGNRGYLRYITPEGPVDGFQTVSITDPGNADRVITVGSTHRYMPHTYGVSYFSSRGPTGDGRMKPDLVAPGEKVESTVPGNAIRRMDGTSMAAPHVSGAAAMLMARNPELAGRPADIKRILCATATDLGRERYFQGAGMVDILRALQSV